MGRILFLVLFSIAGITVIYYYNLPSEKKELPVINPIDVNDEMVDPELLRIGYGHRIGSFSFTNQYGQTVDERAVKGKVFVAEYFFTTCQTICPIMNKQMSRVYNAYRSNTNFRILSFTVDPENDTVEQLKRYAQKHNATSDSWFFLTGEKKELYRLARKSFFVLKPSEALNQGDVGSDFIHTNNFVLIDKQMRIRGYYDGTSKLEVDQLISDIKILLEE